MPTIVGKEISQNGLGLLRFRLPGTMTPDAELFPVLKAALAAGINFWDGADYYGTADENSLHMMNRYFTKYPEDADRVVLSIKSGIADRQTYRVDGSPAYLRQCVENALTILDGKKTIDLFGPARVDKNVPIEETVKGLAEFKREGKIGGIQLSEVAATTIRRAAAAAEIDAVEAEVSLVSAEVLTNGVAAACGELGILVVAHTPLGRGFLTGKWTSLNDIAPGDHLRTFPRFEPGNFEQNMRLVKELTAVAESKGCTLPQLSLNWLKAQSRLPGMPVILPVGGATGAARVKDNATEVDVTDEDIKKIREILDRFPVAGTRYPPAGMAQTEY